MSRPEVTSGRRDGAVQLDATGVRPAGGNRPEGSSRWRRPAVRSVAPAGEGAIGLNATAIPAASGDRREHPSGRRHLAGLVVSPSGEGAIGSNAADMAAGSQRGERSSGRRGRTPGGYASSNLATSSASRLACSLGRLCPTFEGTVGLDAVRVVVASSDRSEVSGGRSAREFRSWSSAECECGVAETTRGSPCAWERYSEQAGVRGSGECVWRLRPLIP